MGAALTSLSTRLNRIAERRLGARVIALRGKGLAQLERDARALSHFGLMFAVSMTVAKMS